MISPFHINNVAVTKATAKRFDPVNRCIYCSDGKPPFTREHIVPQGLGGGLVLPHASCGTCQKTIHAVETYCMRGPFLSHRLGANLVQHLDELGETLPMTFDVNGQPETRRLPIEEFPNYLVLPHIYGPPGMLAGQPPDRPFSVSYKVWGIEEQLRKLHQTGSAVLVDKFNLVDFGRVLAKIAHALAAAEIRIENFDPCLPDLILGRAPELAAYLIGEWVEPPDPPNPDHLLHQVGIGFEIWGQRWLTFARIKLFADQKNAPAYKVIIGELIESPEALAKFGLRSLRPTA